MAGMLYDGPIIDAHHHLWDLRLGRHPWLDWPDRGDALAPLRRNYLVRDYLDMAEGSRIIATVHAETNWDPTDPLGETEWLDGLDKPNGIAARYVAFAALADPDAELVIEKQAAHERVAGIREIISWHPDPTKARVGLPGMMDNTQWRIGVSALQRHGLNFDLLISPWQLDMALRLADAYPDMRFVVNHCGSPMDRDEEGMKRWRQGLRELARAENVVIKISDPVAYDPEWSFDSLAEVVLHCIDCFGAQRCMFASDYPVSALHMPFGQWLTVFDRIVADFTETEKRALFFDCARTVYGVPIQAP